MNCQLARTRLSAYAEGQERAGESDALRRHLLACESCFQEYEYQARLTSPLRELRPQAPPALLKTVICLAASQPPANRIWGRWQVHLSNLMRPVALPAAGGLLAALILFFGVLIPGVSVTRAAAGGDVPTALQTEARVKNLSLLSMEEDVMVEAWVDQQGKIASFEVLNHAHGGAVEEDVHNRLSSVLFTTSFQPATEFGQPISGKLLLSFRRSHINVRG